MSKKIDEQKDNNLLKKLENIGLNEKEARVYMALLPYRDIGSSKLIRSTGLHGQFVYNALERLEELGLAKHVVQNGRKRFSANTPTRLLSLIEEKKFAAQAVAKELQKRFAGQGEQDFEVYQGESAFSAHQFELLERAPEGSEICVLASETERYLQTIATEGLREEHIRLRAEKRISVRYIGSEVQREQLKKREATEPLWEYRIFPGQSTGLTNTDIWHDNITLNIFGDPVVCFTFTSKEVADGYRQFFEALWNISSK